MIGLGNGGKSAHGANGHGRNGYGPNGKGGADGSSEKGFPGGKKQEGVGDALAVCGRVTGKGLSSLINEDVVNSGLFTYFSLFLILANTVIMCLPYAGMPAQDEEMLNRATGLITVGFIVEMVIRYIGVGKEAFWGDPWNIFDVTLISSSVIDTVSQLLVTETSGANLGVLRMLRLLRLMRVFRMMRIVRYWPGLFHIFQCLVGEIGRAHV